MKNMSRTPMKITKTKWKLKKKWRFWRAFRRFFCERKKWTNFAKLRWDYYKKRLIWHQLYAVYGKNLKKLKRWKKKTNFLFGVRVFKVLAFFEMRLDLLLYRAFFVSSIWEARNKISKGLITINGKVCVKRYLAQPNDIIKSLKSQYSTKPMVNVVGADLLSDSTLKRQSNLGLKFNLWGTQLTKVLPLCNTPGFRKKNKRIVQLKRRKKLNKSSNS